MALARCMLQRLWRTQTAAFEREMDRLSNQATSPAGAGTGTRALLAAAAFRSLADHSRSFAQQHRLEAIYDSQFNQALAKLLNLRKTKANIEALSTPLPKTIKSGVSELRSSPASDNRLKARPNSSPPCKLNFCAGEPASACRDNNNDTKNDAIRDPALPRQNQP